MDLGLGIALVLVLAFAFTNGVHDASNAIATLVATGVARPAQAMLLAAVFNTLGPLLFGAAVADTIGGIVAIQGEAAIAVIAAGLLAAVIEGGADAVQWGGLDALRPVGVIGTAIAPALGAFAALTVTRAVQRGLRHGTRRWAAPVRAGEWLMSAWLAFSHGSNDAYRSQPTDGLSSQASPAGVIFGASLVGAPVSTSHVVASSIVGVGGGRRRWRHVRWAVVGNVALAWTVTIPASALPGALTFLTYRAIA